MSFLVGDHADVVDPLVTLEIWVRFPKGRLCYGKQEFRFDPFRKRFSVLFDLSGHGVALGGGVWFWPSYVGCLIWRSAIWVN